MDENRDDHVHHYGYYDEEYAGEIAPGSRNFISKHASTSAVISGMLGLLSVIIAMFTMPITAGVIGFALGLYAMGNGATKLGTTDVVLSILTAGSGLLFGEAILMMWF